MGVCPHCNNTYRALQQHAATCILNPEMYEKTKGFLGSEGNGMIMMQSKYKTASVGLGLPSHTRLSNQYGDWDSIASAFDLKPFRRQKSVRVYRSGTYTEDHTWKSLRIWFANNAPPWHRKDWDAYAKADATLPGAEYIREEWGYTWAQVRAKMIPPPVSVAELGESRDEEENLTRSPEGMPVRPGWRVWENRLGQICMQESYMLI